MIEPTQNKHNKKETKPREKVDRIPLSKKSSEIVKKTIEILTSKHPGVVVNKNSLANWIIENHFSKMTPVTEKQLFDKFYDEIKFLEKSLKTLKQKKKNGEDISIAKVLKQAKPKFRKTTEKASTSEPDKKITSAQEKTTTDSKTS